MPGRRKVNPRSKGTTSNRTKKQRKATIDQGLGKRRDPSKTGFDPWQWFAPTYKVK
jgi:hypothetical protein